MTINSFKTSAKYDLYSENSLINKYGMNILNTPFVFEEGIKLGLGEKYLVVEKLIEAVELAKTNVQAGNITGRGFATNVCTNDYYWSIGTNFNNTRNDISSICGERNAILCAYNDALLRYSLNPKGAFDFKIKYLCMASNVDLKDITTMVAPCEDCLSWLNTNKYFNFNTLIFAFERNQENKLVVRASRLDSFLPYKTFSTSVDLNFNKEIKFSRLAKKVINDKKFLSDNILTLINSARNKYNENKFSKISGQNTACSILVNNEIIASYKIDWTKRWNVEPLEFSCAKAIERFGGELNIQAIAYFGDDFVQKDNHIFSDGLVSIKSIGRIRQKYANSDTLLILNCDKNIYVLTIGEFLPKKFVQGYKIL